MASPTSKSTPGTADHRHTKLGKNNPAVDWRETDTSADTRKSHGIPPRAFHGKNVRYRPGADYVKEIHTKSEESALRERKKEHIKLQQLKRSAFKEITSLKTWPLQQLALQDYQTLTEAYLNEKRHNDEERLLYDTVDPDYIHGNSSSSCASTDKKRAMNDKNLSPNKSQLKQKYLNDFIAENDIAGHNVAVVSHEPERKFDPGLWSMEPRIFSVEKANGKRKYLVGHLGRIMDYMWRKTESCNRHFYELILEKTPCRLYFDLEYSIPDNPGIPNENLLLEFYEELVTELLHQFPDYAEGFDRKCIVDLDSSTPQKFSRHWIVHLPSTALFKDNDRAGKFVKNFIQKLADDVATGLLKERAPYLQEHLFVNPKDTLNGKDTEGTIQELPLSKKSCFVDIGVYTRNRLFRLLGSSKWGKFPDGVLRFAKTNQFPLPSGFENVQFSSPTMIISESCDSSDDDTEGLDREGKEKQWAKFKAQTDWSLHASVTGLTLIVPINIRKIDYPLLPDIVNTYSRTRDQPLSSLNGHDTSTHRTPVYCSTRPSFGNSPYPYLEDFVLRELACRGGVQGSIRSWALDYGPVEGGTVPVGISFHMVRNRWCECIRRAHKSNNILWKVDFRRRQCIQTCFDPECRTMNFRGTPVDLPFEVALKLEDSLFEEAIVNMDLHELPGKNLPFTTLKTDEDGIDLEKAIAKMNLGEPTIISETVESNEGDPFQLLPSFDDSLPDDALLDAINLNPDLFS